MALYCPRRPAALAAVALRRRLQGRGRRAARPGRHARPGRARPCGVLAYGDLKRVELAMALANQPRLLLMDEPTAGMAPRERIALMALTARLARAQQDRRAVHRARHGRGVQPGRPHRRARPRPAHRRRPARRGARQSRRAARSISGRVTDARGQGPARLSTAAPISCTASRSRRTPARWWRCWAATAPASRRR